MKQLDERAMREHWESEAVEYIEGREWSRADSRALELLDIGARERLLEIGFGSGMIAAEIKRLHPSIFYAGVDFADTFLRTTREKLTDWGRLIKASASGLPFKEKSFDWALEMSAIHHFPRDFISYIVAECARILIPGGRFMAVENWGAPLTSEGEELAYNLQNKRNLTRTNREYHPSDDEWRDMYIDAGLEVEYMEHVERPLNLERFAKLEDSTAKEDLAKLQGIWADKPAATKMTIFICRKV